MKLQNSNASSASLQKVIAFYSTPLRVTFAILFALTSCSNEKNTQNSETMAVGPLKPLILMYHETAPQGKLQSDVTTANFEAQLNWLKAQNYTTISMDDLYELKANGKKLPAKPVLLTFDDGYIGNYTYAKPILEKRNMKASFFVHTDYVGVKEGAHSHMSWDELKEIDKSPLFEVYSHTKSHPSLTTLKPDALLRELKISKETLEKNLGGTRPYLAYPFGDYNATVIDAARSQGYRLALAVGFKGTFGKSGVYSIPRVGIGLDVSTIAKFRSRIGAQ